MTWKAAKHIWFLKKLKRVGVSSQDDLVYYYQAVIRPVLKYVWHTSITGQQLK